MTPEWKVFVDFCPKSALQPRFTCRGQIWRKSAVAKFKEVAEKSSRCTVADKKNSGVEDTFEPPSSVPLTDGALNFVNVVGLCRAHVYRLWSRSAVTLHSRNFINISMVKTILRTQAGTSLLPLV